MDEKSLKNPQNIYSFSELIYEYIYNPIEPFDNQHGSGILKQYFLLKIHSDYIKFFPSPPEVAGPFPLIQRFAQVFLFRSHLSR